MEFEREFFIQVLSDHLNGESTVLKQEINWKELLHISQKHQLQAIIYYQCRDYINPNIKPLFEKAYFATLFYYSNYKVAHSELSKCFIDNDIPYISIKGVSLSNYYPIPEFRTMGDLDFLIQNKDRTKACNLLLNNGYTIHPHVDNREWVFSRNSIMIELHDHLVYDDLVSSQSFKEFFNNAWLYNYDNVLDVSFHFLYILLHLRKHLLNCGVGFRQFYDLAMFSKYEYNLKWEWIKEILCDLDLYKFATICFSFIYKWFGVKTPIDIIELDEDFYIDATQRIFMNGVFGFNNPDNISNAAVNVARKGKYYQVEMIKSAIQFIFPPYRQLVVYDPYKFIKNRPYFVPVAWVYRFFRGLTKIRDGKKWFFSKFASKKTIIERDNFLKQWRL